MHTLGRASYCSSAALQRYGRIGVLGDNAGYARRGTIEELDGDAVERMFDTNVVALKTGCSRSPGKPGS